jgi:hypothetical protein
MDMLGVMQRSLHFKGQVWQKPFTIQGQMLDFRRPGAVSTRSIAISSIARGQGDFDAVIHWLAPRLGELELPLEPARSTKKRLINTFLETAVSEAKVEVFVSKLDGRPDLHLKAPGIHVKGKLDWALATCRPEEQTPYQGLVVICEDFSAGADFDAAMKQLWICMTIAFAMGGQHPVWGLYRGSVAGKSQHPQPYIQQNSPFWMFRVDSQGFRTSRELNRDEAYSAVVNLLASQMQASAEPLADSLHEPPPRLPPLPSWPSMLDTAYIETWNGGPVLLFAS